MGIYAGTQEVLACPDHRGNVATRRINCILTRVSGRSIYLYTILV